MSTSGTGPAASETTGAGAVSLRALGLLAAFTAGAGIAVQARINGALADRLGDGVVAALISFGVGLVLLLVAVPVLPAARRGLRRVRRAFTDGGLRWWHFTGGLCGALLVASQGLTVGVLGVAVFTVAVVGGQIGSSLVMDRLGVGPAGAKPVSARRLLGAVLAIGAVGLAVSSRFAHPAGLALAVLPLLAGIGSAWQQGVNGRVGVAARAGEPRSLVASTLPATTVNFTVGMAALVVVAAIGVAVRGLPHSPPTEPLLYLGGPLGIAFIAAMVVLVRLIGVLLLGLGMVSGQLVGSLLLDVLAPTVPNPLEPTTVLGVVLTLVAAGIAALPERDEPRRSARMDR